MNPTIQELYETNCSFDKKCNPHYTFRTYQSGITHCKTQCEKCGNSFGQPISKKDIDSPEIKPFDEERYKQCIENIQKPLSELSAIQQRLIEVRRSIKKDFYEKHLKIEFLNVENIYNQYLASTHWQNKRAVVLSRDNYMCRYCEKSKATQVHHLSYANLGNESEFELISVCYSCHQLIHEIVINEPIYDSIRKSY